MIMKRSGASVLLCNFVMQFLISNNICLKLGHFWGIWSNFSKKKFEKKHFRNHIWRSLLISIRS